MRLNWLIKLCVISSSVVQQEVTDSDIEQILADEEVKRAFNAMFGSTDTDSDVDDIDNEEQENGFVDEQILTDMIGTLESNFNMQFERTIIGVKCSAHCLQLGIDDGLKQLRNITMLLNFVGKQPNIYGKSQRNTS